MSRLEEILKTRGGLYAFLAKMYLENPPKEFAEDLKSGKFFSSADSLALNPEMKVGIEALKNYAKDTKGDIYEEMEDEFVNLFIMGPNRILPFSSEHTEMDSTESRLKAKQIYAKAGFKKSEDCPETSDHIALHLEFMRYICKSQLEAIEDKKKLRALLVSQREYLDDLLGWAPNFCDKIQESERASFYKGIAELTKGFMKFEGEVIDDLITSI